MKKFIKCIATSLSGCLALGVIVSKLESRRNIKGWVDGHEPYGFYERHVKRSLDFGLSLFALIVLSPILLITAILVKCKLGSPIFFVQVRTGLGGQSFMMRKFRSMTDECDEDGNLLADEKRLTGFGKFLRSTSVDELPELLNIVKGEMSIVGPRPLVPQYLPYYTKEESHRHDVRPGLTGLAQANGRNALGWGEKIHMDVAYVWHITFWGDLKIIFDTIREVLKREGISSKTSVTMESFVDYCQKMGRTARS